MCRRRHPSRGLSPNMERHTTTPGTPCHSYTIIFISLLTKDFTRFEIWFVGSHLVLSPCARAVFLTHTFKNCNNKCVTKVIKTQLTAVWFCLLICCTKTLDVEPIAAWRDYNRFYKNSVVFWQRDTFWPRFISQCFHRVYLKLPSVLPCHSYVIICLVPTYYSLTKLDDEPVTFINHLSIFCVLNKLVILKTI